MSRPPWDLYFMEIARVAATRATCDRAQVGCVIVQDNRILATGYNGSIAGEPHCLEAGHLEINGECVRSLHAEENAINNAAKFGVATNGATAYTTHFPCWRCFRTLASAGIKKIVYAEIKYSGLNIKLLNQMLDMHNTYKVSIYNIGNGHSWYKEMSSLIKSREGN